MLISPKYKDYQDYQKHITLLDGIEDIQPYFVELPDAPAPKKIINFGLPIEEQFFKRETIPTKVRNLNKLPREEALKIAERDDEIALFIVDQWHKRMNGMFIYIHGTPIYITGTNWFYLNYFPIDIGLPQFRTTDRDYWYWRKFCVWDNPRVYGGINFTGRRFGKSAMAGCEVSELTTRHKKRLSGMQSKTDTDAEQLFKKFVYGQCKKLPFYFRPIFDPINTKEFNMDYPRGGIDAELESLESKIDFRPSTEIAYDSEKLLVYVMDEAGKYQKSDPHGTWDKVKYCFKDEDRIIGKAIITTTVEEMERGGGKKFKKLWDESSRIPAHGQINELGQTNSGLIPYFTPAYSGYIYDQYGYPIILEPKPYQQKYRYKRLIDAGETQSDALKMSNMGAIELLETERKALKSEAGRQDHKRKYPFSIKEAFTSAFKSCHFSYEKVECALSKFIYGSPYKTIRGNFEWKDAQRDTEVVFRPCENGRWLVSYVLPQEESNKYEIRNGKKIPGNTMKGVAGADPYKFSQLAEGSNKSSKGSGYVWWYFDPSIDTLDKEEEQHITDDFIVEYLNRPASRELYNEDMLMMCIYYGIKIYIEINVEHTMNYFVDRGYEGYLLFARYAKKEGRALVIKEKEKAGAYSTGDKMKDPMFAHMEWYVENRIFRCKFHILIQDICDVEYEHTRKYDAFMGAGYCLLGAKMINKRPGLNNKKEYSNPIGKFEVKSF